MATLETDKPLLLNAMLGGKDEVAMMRFFFAVTDLYLGIEVEGVDEDVKRSYYFLSLYVADIEVAKSKKVKPRSSVVKLEWKNKQMLVLLCFTYWAVFTSYIQLFRAVVNCEN